MTDSLPNAIEIITESAHLSHAVQGMSDSSAIAIDTESNSRHRYPEQLCLIQIATGHKIYIIDAISLKDLTPLKAILEHGSIMKILHGADYDIRSLDRHRGFHIRNLFDTEIAARFSGATQFGLAALLKDILGLNIEKSNRLQQSDWGLRPLSAEAIEYAASDVRHLFDLQEILDQRLRALGRTEWVAEEFARLEQVRYTEPNLETAYLSIKGAKNLDGPSLAILQSLFRFREMVARRLRRPPYFIIPDPALISLSVNPTLALAEVPGLGQMAIQRFGRGIQQAVTEGIAAPPIHVPPCTIERLSIEQIQRLNGLKAWRISLGETLSIEPFFVWPTASLERLAKAPDTLDAELGSDSIRRWQRENFSQSLRAHLNFQP